ncbi:MAG: hypothetical protein KKF46_00105, partial [Nanoarchaeota archaeon]|nr:hypothetical protein [Nanoarchaeota archaeon]
NQSTELTSFETLTKNLPAWNQAILQGYIDTNNLGIGTYDAKITLFFADLTKEYDGIIDIIEEPKPQEEEKEKPGSSKTVVRIILGLAVILLIVLFFFLIRLLIPKKDKKQKSK